MTQPQGTTAERLAAYYATVAPPENSGGPRSPQARAEADEEGRRRAAAGSTDWVDRYGFGDEDAIFGRGL
jgi:hypothetical protein